MCVGSINIYTPIKNFSKLWKVVRAVYSSQNFFICRYQHRQTLQELWYDSGMNLKKIICFFLGHDIMAHPRGGKYPGCTRCNHIEFE